MRNFKWSEIGQSQKRYILCLLGLTLLGIVLLSAEPTKPQTTSISPQAQTVNQPDMADRLADILSKVEGAGKVMVEINYKTKSELSYATDKKLRRQSTQESQSEESEETIVFYNNGSGIQSALVLNEKEPEIAGVLIVAEGAKNAAVKRELAQAAAVLFDIPEYRVTVLVMKGGE